MREVLKSGATALTPVGNAAVVRFFRLPLSGSLDRAKLAESGKSNNFFQIAVTLLLLVWLFHYLRFNVGVFAHLTIKSVLFLLAVTLIAFPCRTKALPPSFWCVAISINACCLFYIFTARLTYSLGTANPILDSAWLPITLGVLAFRFPALMAWPALCIQWSKLNVALDAGWGQLNGADYVIIPDLALLLVLMLGGFVTYCALSKRSKASRHLPSLDPKVFFSAAVLATAAVHLSNYFYSGIGKLNLSNAGIFTWVLENKTYLLSVIATEGNFFTLQNIFSSHSDQIFCILQLLNVPMNLMVIIGQLAAVTCLLSLRKAAFTTAFYDLMHVSIFLVSGIFFWKWIVLNASFIYAFRNIRKTVFIPVQFRLFCCVLVVAAPVAFSIVTLAWFDTGASNEAYFEVKTTAGETVRVPSNFFLDSSIDVAQQRFSRPYTGWLPTGTWGSTLDANLMKRLAQDCEGAAKPWTFLEQEKARITALLRRQKQLVAAGSDGNGHLNYDLYPHHIWSAPWLFETFNHLDLRQISSVVLVVESKCITVNGRGQIEWKRIGRVEFEFPA